MNVHLQEGILRDETYRITGCAMEILNTLGHGLLEKTYENALVVEFDLQEISYRQQPRYPVLYKRTMIGEYIPDLIAFEQIIVDVKTIERIGERELGQMLNYLKITGLQVGLLLNFRHPRLEWKRVILSTNPPVPS